ncbi:MAG: choice-of-anchor D domain-containing protein [Myxococcales bacterium]|nr:choice-of-anchor D domain-containing protein [Myxococcales bacterium]
MSLPPIRRSLRLAVVQRSPVGIFGDVGKRVRTSFSPGFLGLLVIALAFTALASTGCDRDLYLGSTRTPLMDRLELHERSHTSNPHPCVGTACVTTPATGGVAPQSTQCLNGAGWGCVATLEVRAGLGPALSAGATLPLPLTLKTDAVHTLTLRNVAPTQDAAGLRVVAVTIEELCDGQPCAGEPGFVCTRGPDALPCGVAQSVNLVPVGATGPKTHTVVLRRKHQVPGLRTATVRVLVAGDPSHNVLPWHGELAPVAGKPNLAAAHDTVMMPWKGEKTTTTAMVTLMNTGDATAEVYGLDLTGAAGFSMRTTQEPSWHKGSHFLPTPIRLAPSQSTSIEIRFVPTDTAKKHAALTFESNSATALAPIAIVGNGSTPCLSISPAKAIDFGTLQLGDCSERRLDLQSCGTAALALTSVSSGVPGLNATLVGHPTMSKAQPALIAHGGAKKLRIRYCAPAIGQDAPGTLKGTVQVAADGLPPRHIPVQVEVVTSLCPVAKFKIAQGHDVLPLTVLHLDATASSAPINGALTYSWTVKQPAGSVRSLTPSAEVAQPTFTPAVAGAYTFCLTVRDALGHPSCEKNCQTVQVVPEAGLYVELLWQTPGDPDESDVGAGAGSDLDLHVAHPLASGPDLDCDGAGDPWFHGTYDAYWGHATPSWGSSAPQAGDDPSMDLDDTDGAGPELIGLPKPQKLGPKSSYQLGVHYWNDHGFGSALASVRVYAGGTQIAALGPVKLMPLDLWTVGRVSFNSGGTPQLQSCLQSAATCSGGKRWVSAGQACMSPCYLPANPPATNHAPACKP